MVMGHIARADNLGVHSDLVWMQDAGRFSGTHIRFEVFMRTGPRPALRLFYSWESENVF